MKKFEILTMGISVDASGLLSLIKLEVSNSSVNVKVMRTIGSNCGVSITMSDISVILGNQGQVKVIINIIIYIFRQIKISRVIS